VNSHPSYILIVKVPTYLGLVICVDKAIVIENTTYLTVLAATGGEEKSID
jgi:hypothetical protein